MWKHAAASALSHAAAAFDQRKLKATKTHVCASVDVPAGKFGHVKQDGKPVFPTSIAQQPKATLEGACTIMQACLQGRSQAPCPAGWAPCFYLRLCVCAYVFVYVYFCMHAWVCECAQTLACVRVQARVHWHDVGRGMCLCTGPCQVYVHFHPSQGQWRSAGPLYWRLPRSSPLAANIAQPAGIPVTRLRAPSATRSHACLPLRHAAPPLGTHALAAPPSPLFFTCSPNLVEALTEVLEEEDVMRLACHVEALLVYQATVTAARRAQPMPAYAGVQGKARRSRRGGLSHLLCVCVCVCVCPPLRAEPPRLGCELSVGEGGSGGGGAVARL